MKNLSIFFKDTLNAQNQLAFTKKEHMFNVAMVFHMSYKLLLHYSLIQMDRTYNPARNDSLLNIHKPTMLSIWRDNVDCQLVLCKHVVLKYMSKYASKAKPQKPAMQFFLTLHMLHKVTTPFFNQSNNSFTNSCRKRHQCTRDVSHATKNSSCALQPSLIFPKHEPNCLPLCF